MLYFPTEIQKAVILYINNSTSLRISLCLVKSNINTHLSIFIRETDFKSSKLMKYIGLIFSVVVALVDYREY